LWSIGPNIYAAIIKVVAYKPSSPDEYKARIPHKLGLAHVSIEVCKCAGAAVVAVALPSSIAEPPALSPGATAPEKEAGSDQRD
jgi:hypothetical protein